MTKSLMCVVATGICSLAVLAESSTVLAENCVDCVKRVRTDLIFRWIAQWHAKNLWVNWPTGSMWKGSVPRQGAVMVLDTIPLTGIENGHVAYVVQGGYSSGTRKDEWVDV